MASLTVTIQTFADTLCPWSYLGKVTLDRAMAAFQAQNPNVDFELSWNPFYLYPDAKVSGYDKIDLFTRVTGTHSQDVLARVNAEAKALGLALSLEGRVGNTRDSHALLLLAQRRSQADLRQLQTVLYRGTFEEGRDISDRAFLLEAAAQVGWNDEEEVRAWLDSKETRMLVDGMSCRARQNGIAAVPSFVVQGRYEIGGKQGERVFLDLFERIRREEAARHGKGKGRIDDVVVGE